MRRGVSGLLSGWLVVLGWASGAAAAPSAGGVRFTEGPAAVRAEKGVRITFAVSAPADVEVAVLEAGGRVVRHLAAGVLGGKNPPPAPLKPGLSQRLLWDGTDDFGRPAGKGPFTVRVRAGLRGRFGRLIGGDPYTFGAVDSLAVDEEGNLYVMGFGGLLNQGQMTLRVFGADGRYLRELIPFPADLPADAMKDIAWWDDERKTFRPRNRKNLNPDFYGTSRKGCLKLVAVTRKDGVILTDGTRLYALETSGAVKGDSFLQRVMWPKKLTPWGSIPNSGKGPLSLALSPDGKYAYLAGPFTAKTRYGHRLNPAFPPGRIFRMRLDAPGEVMREFVTIPVAHKEGVGGAWTKGMGYEFGPRGPVHGIACDRRGRLYVCDREHRRIAVFDPAGRLLEEYPVDYPDQVAVHPETGAIYVLERDRVSYSRWYARLLRFDRGGKAPAVVFDAPSPGPNTKMALSVAGGKTMVWLAGVRGGLVALEDTGSAFQPRKTRFRPRPGVQAHFNRIAVDYLRDEVYVNNGASLMFRYNGLTGEGGLLTKNGKPFYATDLAVGYDGLLYVRRGLGKPLGQDYSGPLARFTRDLEPVPYAETGTHILSKYIYSRYGVGYAERGIGVAPDGKVYVSWMYGGWVKYAVTGFGEDGKPLEGRYLVGKCAPDNYKRGLPKGIDSAVIGPVTAANGGLRVDLAGNIYLGMRLWPAGASLPGKFAGDPGYIWSTGSVVKFTPAGGQLVAGRGWGSDPFQGARRTPGAKGLEMLLLPRKSKVFAEGAVAAYTGLAPFSHAGFGGNTCCVCRVPRFDIDRYGRLALPNAVTNSVLILDNAGNLVAEVGRYGNFDSRFTPPGGKKPLAAVPDIPLTWPTGAGFSEKHLYVNDTYSRRVVRVDFSYAAEASCPVR